jgi:hypothetical protein
MCRTLSYSAPSNLTAAPWKAPVQEIVRNQSDGELDDHSVDDRASGSRVVSLGRAVVGLGAQEINTGAS